MAKKKALLTSENPAAAAVKTGRNLEFRVMGPPQQHAADNGATTLLRVADVPGGRILWVSRSHMNAVTRVVELSDAMCFVPDAPEVPGPRTE